MTKPNLSSSPINNLPTPKARFAQPGSCSKNSTRCMCPSSRVGASMVRDFDHLFVFSFFPGVHPSIHLSPFTISNVFFFFRRDRTKLRGPDRTEQDPDRRTTRRRTRPELAGFSSQPATRIDQKGPGKATISLLSMDRTDSQTTIALERNLSTHSCYCLFASFLYLF